MSETECLKDLMLKYDMLIARFIVNGKCLKIRRKLIFEVMKLKYRNLFENRT